jgi:hypothetical protein
MTSEDIQASPVPALLHIDASRQAPPAHRIVHTLTAGSRADKQSHWIVEQLIDTGLKYRHLIGICASQPCLFGSPPCLSVSFSNPQYCPRNCFDIMYNTHPIRKVPILGLDTAKPRLQPTSSREMISGRVLTTHPKGNTPSGTSHYSSTNPKS